MTLLQLRYFQSVCLYNSVSKAAEAMHISQPAVSIAIKELEEEFGVSLFTRNRRRLLLTNEGAFFLDKVSEILRQIDSLNKSMSDLGKGNHVLNVSLISMSGSNLFLNSLNRFRSLYPDIQIGITECSSARAVEHVQENTCQAAIVIADKQKSSALDGLILLQTNYVFCIGKNHPMAQLPQCDLGKLEGQSLILLQDETFLTKELKHRFSRLGITPKVLLYTMNLPLIRRLISAGEDGTFLTRETAALLPDDVVQIPLVQPIEISYALIWKRKQTLSSDLTKLIALIKEDYPNAKPYE